MRDEQWMLSTLTLARLSTKASWTLSATTSTFRHSILDVWKTGWIMRLEVLWLLKVNDSCSTTRLNNSEFLRGSILGHSLATTSYLYWWPGIPAQVCWWRQTEGLRMICSEAGQPSGGVGGMDWQESYEILEGQTQSPVTWGALVPCNSSGWGPTGGAVHIWYWNGRVHLGVGTEPWVM